MKKLIKSALTLIGLGTAIGGALVYLKNKGYITVTTGTEDEDYDDFCDDYETPERSYINIDTQAMKEKAKEVACDLKDEIKDKAVVVYDEAKKLTKEASEKVVHTIEKTWHTAEDVAEDVADDVKDAFEEAEEKVEEKVEEFFNDEA